MILHLVTLSVHDEDCILSDFEQLLILASHISFRVFFCLYVSLNKCYPLTLPWSSRVPMPESALHHARSTRILQFFMQALNPATFIFFHHCVEQCFNFSIIQKYLTLRENNVKLLFPNKSLLAATDEILVLQRHWTHRHTQKKGQKTLSSTRVKHLCMW